MAFRRLSAAVALAGCVSACGGIIDPSQNKVEPFTGTLRPLGSVEFSNYTLNKSGEAEVTITSVSPTPANGPIWLQIGQIVSGTCQLLFGYDSPAIVNRKIQYGILNKGSYCLVVYDPGVLTVPVTFAGNFSHP